MNKFACVVQSLTFSCGHSAKQIFKALIMPRLPSKSELRCSFPSARAGDELRKKMETEESEIERLQQEIQELQYLRHDSDLEDMSSNSDSSYESEDEDDMNEMLSTLIQENLQLEVSLLSCHVVHCHVGCCHVVCDTNEMLSTLVQKYCSWG